MSVRLFDQTSDDSSRVITESEIAVPVEFVDSIDEAITPVDSVEIRDAIRDNLVLRFHKGRLWASCAEEISSRLAIALRVEFWHGTELLAHGSICIDASRIGGRPLQVPLSGDVATLDIANQEDGEWFVRLYGDGELALRQFDREEYWNGSLDLPLAFVAR